MRTSGRARPTRTESNIRVSCAEEAQFSRMAFATSPERQRRVVDAGSAMDKGNPLANARGSSRRCSARSAPGLLRALRPAYEHIRDLRSRELDRRALAPGQHLADLGAAEVDLVALEPGEALGADHPARGLAPGR